MPVPQVRSRVERTLARDGAYDKLRDWIVRGLLLPGELLRDQEIAQTLGVSRTPVREALRRLEDEGLVETALNRWTRVAALDLEKAIETCTIIAALEALALAKAFPALTRKDLERMRRANRLMQEAISQRDGSAALSADEAFHDIWNARSGNAELFVMVAQLKTRMRRVELAYWDRSAHTRQSFREHQMLIRALREGSKRRALRALRQNWEGSMVRLRELSEKSKNRALPQKGNR
jgi:DNA-binding GntR family transcriptional regulator